MVSWLFGVSVTFLSLCAAGQLVGTGGDVAGVVISFVSTGAAQIGFGANGKNANCGSSGWAAFAIEQGATPAGWFTRVGVADFNVDRCGLSFTDPPPFQCVVCQTQHPVGQLKLPTEAVADPAIAKV